MEIVVYGKLLAEIWASPFLVYTLTRKGTDGHNARPLFLYMVRLQITTVFYLPISSRNANTRINSMIKRPSPSHSRGALKNNTNNRKTQENKWVENAQQLAKIYFLVDFLAISQLR